MEIINNRGRPSARGQGDVMAAPSVPVCETRDKAVAAYVCIGMLGREKWYVS